MVTQVQKKAVRDYAILNTLATMDMATRSQLQKIHGLGSNRNATRILKNLDVYTNHFRDYENVYYLNKRGRDLVGCKKVVQKTPNFLHTIMRNDVYIYFNCPKKWVNEFQTPEIVPDAVFEANGVQYFLEVDRLQKMNVNIEKLKTYKKLKDSGMWQMQNDGKFPVVLFYTTKDSRKYQLMESNPGLQLQILTKEDLL